ncbi:xanthine dehydrogenase family protein molybdopterin-binding subunit [Serratia ureilytica]|uniref:molybdopterin cofactor-binding domain-containing protein n=1 Tax=Serratia ureilytica TaxID=300181 RepID=UPI0011C9188E|nr:molybdopterin cofactor-binding domain-containing protein [Serratia ureilytica]TXE57559.1 xanthine dehydrogenase family protein molybdopterin-binding subunit [Serratia ureilytica]
MSISQVPLSRRRFIVGAGALVIGAYLPSTGALARSNAPAAAGATAFDANAFVQIGADGIVTVISKHTEVGQGVYTGMATLVAEELDADWAQVRVVAAPVDTNIYKNLAFGFQGTGGSSSVANAYEQMRRMGAMARALLVQAAAQSWKTSAQEITVQAGKIRHAASGREAGFGEFAELAATLPPPDPASLALKDPANFTLIGYLFWDGESVKARYGCQIQTLDHKQLCDLFELPPEKVQIETILAGGSFGRRIDLGNPTLGPDLAADMAAAAKGIGPGHGVKVVWTREDDIRNGWYRPMILHRLRGAIRGGKVVGWTDTVVGHSWTRHSAMDALVVNGLDQMMVEGASEVPYTFEAFRCDAHIVPGKVPTTSLRSVASTHTGHAVESFIDQLLQETGQDPVEGRLALMGDAPRAAGVLRAVAKAADWQGAKVVDGRARGVGVAKAFDTYVAQVAEVSIGEGGIPKVHKVWCAVDCGVAVNPDVIRAQIEGGIGYGLNLALYGNITLKDGVVEQSNFNNFRPLRINEMPEVEVIIVPSTEKPTGVGELGVPTIAPAVGNALALLGRPRASLSLPLHNPTANPASDKERT